ncbi:hypothetical protein [Hamadaea tsunoensis]|uniref:hypothetical protein n=1 Tax=Hamadaea tsunoensis TaxID=53368 RepID=UPI00041237B4|nr:hypothetical protein [Hamadaea tsunoensis]
MPPPEVRADPVELTRLADTMLTASQHISDAWRAAQAAISLSQAAFGDSAGAAGVHNAHEGSADDADLAIGRLVAVLEGDMDRLYRIAFAYKKADDDAARKAQQSMPHGHNIPF